MGLSIRSVIRQYISSSVRVNLLIAYDRLQRHFITSPSVYSIDETIDHITNNDVSVVRYGDGEMALIRGYDLSFQDCDPDLRARLMQVLNSDLTNLIVCIPDCFGGYDRYTDRVKRFFESEMGRSRKVWRDSTNKERVYYNSFISRLYVEWRDRSQSVEWFKKVKQIWLNQDLTIIEGQKSRLGVGNDLFEGAKSIERILCPETFAYRKYNQILSEAIKIDKDRLVLVALGPTAKPLVYDLCETGNRAIDIGHIDVEYEWFLKQSEAKVKLEGKYVGEVDGGDDVNESVDEAYVKSIICTIK